VAVRTGKKKTTQKKTSRSKKPARKRKAPARSWKGFLLGAVIGLAVAGILVAGILYFPGWFSRPEPAPGSKTLADTASFDVYFGNAEMGPGSESCDAVYPVGRQILRPEDVVRAALEDMLNGPTPEEEERGFFSSINPGVRLLGLEIRSGRAIADFSRDLEEGVAGSCMVEAIRAQIERTLQQFPGIEEVEIRIEGRTEDVLQP